MLCCLNRCWQSAPMSGHIPWPPKGERGMPSWLASHARCGGWVSAVGSRIWPPLLVLHPISAGTTVPVPITASPCPWVRAAGEGCGPSSGTSWRHSRRAGTNGHRDTLVPVCVPASPGTKPGSTRQGKLRKSGHKVALSRALCLKGRNGLFPGGQKKAPQLAPHGWHPMAGTPRAPQQCAPSQPQVRRIRGAAEAGPFAFWDGAFPGGEVGGGEGGDLPSREAWVPQQVWPPRQVRPVRRSCGARVAPRCPEPPA